MHTSIMWADIWVAGTSTLPHLKNHSETRESMRLDLSTVVWAT